MLQQNEAFERFKDRVMEELGDSVVQLGLFGSVARGDHHEDSDVDVLVVVEDRQVVEREVFSIALDVMLETDVYISPKVVSAEHFSKMRERRGSFMMEVEREMKVYGGAS